MRSLALVVAVLLPLVATPAFAASELPAQLDALVAPHFPSDQPGAVVLVKKDDQILLRKAYGMANLELGVPMRPELSFRIGSMTKQFTAAAIMMLVDQSKLALHDDIRKYVPSYPSHGPVVTIEQLLTHTAGVPNYTDQAAFAKRHREDLSHEELLATFKDLPLEFTPGEKWSYSNSGYYLLGMVIEKVSGKSYAQYVDDNIFKPLHMTHTRYDDLERIVVGRTSGYDRAGGSISNATMLSMALPYAAGSLRSTVDDLALWDRALSDGKLLRKASWARVFAAAKLKDGSSAHYGFGWGIADWQGHRVVAHGGGIPGFNSQITRLPEDHVVVVILCNSLPAPTALDPLALKLAALTIGKPMIDPPTVVVAPAILDRYVGSYKVDDKLRLVIRRDGDHLAMERTGGPRHALWAEAETKFFVKDTPLRAAFVVDAAGHVSGVDVKQPDGSVLRRARVDEPAPVEATAIAVEPKLLERYLGEYELQPGFTIAITREGARLFGQATGQQRFELFASAPAEFFLKAVAAQVSFHVDAAGRADSLVLHQNGAHMPGKRVR